MSIRVINISIYAPSNYHFRRSFHLCGLDPIDTSNGLEIGRKKHDASQLMYVQAKFYMVIHTLPQKI